LLCALSHRCSVRPPSYRHIDRFVQHVHPWKPVGHDPRLHVVALR
jgi:hypothetical protein